MPDLGLPDLLVPESPGARLALARLRLRWTQSPTRLPAARPRAIVREVWEWAGFAQSGPRASRGNLLPAFFFLLLFVSRQPAVNEDEIVGVTGG